MPGLVNIISPPQTTRLTTIPVAKDELGLTDSSVDIRVGNLIDRASAVISNYCGVTFGKQTVTETFRFGWAPGIGPSSENVAPYGTPLNLQFKPLILTGSPVVVVASVTENGTALDPAAPDYETDTAAGLVFRLRNGQRSWFNVPLVVVQYTAGYALPYDANRNLPFDLEDACLALIRSGFFSQGRDPNIAMDMLHGDRTQFWDRSLSAMALDDAMKAQISGYVARAW